MKRLLLISAAAAAVVTILFGAVVAFADRVDVWLASTVAINKVELAPLPDGGCVVTTFGSYSNGTTTVSEGSHSIEVAGANRTTCLDILNTKAPALFKADKGL